MRLAVQAHANTLLEFFFVSHPSKIDTFQSHLPKAALDLLESRTFDSVWVAELADAPGLKSPPLAFSTTSKF